MGHLRPRFCFESGDQRFFAVRDGEEPQLLVIDDRLAHFWRNESAAGPGRKSHMPSFLPFSATT